jgi:rhamnulokinase
MMEKVFALVPKAEVFEQTGIQFMPINTLYQLMSLVESQAPQLAIADTFLTAPDLLNYWLTGTKVCEFSNATTTQLFNPLTGDWAFSMLDRLDIPSHIFPDIVPPGTRLGEYEGIPVIAPACHDTGSAVAAVPTQTADYAYISSGTWSLVGLEVAQPVISTVALEANVTNEGGVNSTYRLLKNVMGLWIIQQCRTAWQQQGYDYTYTELVRLAQEAPPLRSLIAPNDPRFLPPGDHPAHVQEFCLHSGQAVPETPGQLVRCVLESLALAYREVLERLLAVSGRQANVIHIVGGGTQNELLNQMTANATGRPVIAGPIEATVIGNALVQLIALGELKDIAEARQLAAQVDILKRYEPQETSAWEDAYQRYKDLEIQTSSLGRKL